ncbi:hypothetical protein WN48_10786 [Eufriesea mexicana]|uniref:Ig-like domain-containing protein n=1 Tax=Eufriesea mexicana TaxID=516756 RepID=A0A310S9E7_9HYME|nr:hypothetical protein WN48_10786 [Eufriesea mexicana]
MYGHAWLWSLTGIFLVINEIVPRWLSVVLVTADVPVDRARPKKFPRYGLNEVRDKFVGLWLHLGRYTSLPMTTIKGVEGNKVHLPCDIHSADDDNVSMVLWYKEGAGEPIYSQTVKNGTVKGKAFFRLADIGTEDGPPVRESFAPKEGRNDLPIEIVGRLSYIIGNPEFVSSKVLAIAHGLLLSLTGPLSAKSLVLLPSC